MSLKPPNLSYRDLVRRLVPPWLSDRSPRPLTVGFRLIYAMGTALDGIFEWTVQGLSSKFPGFGTPTALPYIGRDRGVIRGPNESDESYAARLIPWLDAWRTAGSPVTVLKQLRPFFLPDAPPPMRTVTNSGTWYVYDADTETVSVSKLANWNWDDKPELWARLWLIIDSSTGFPWGPDGTWGDGNAWGDGRTWGTDATRAEVETVQAIIGQWKAAHGYYINTIISFGLGEFDPSTPEPDGTWGKFYKLDEDGAAVPSRSLNARYWDGAA
jgi:hypothetical protein